MSYVRTVSTSLNDKRLGLSPGGLGLTPRLLLPVYSPHYPMDLAAMEPAILVFIGVPAQEQVFPADYQDSMAHVGQVPAVKDYDLSNLQWLDGVQFRRDDVARLQGWYHASSPGHSKGNPTTWHGRKAGRV